MQLFFFDTETTGFLPTDRIIQFGAIYGFYDEKTKTFHEERVINQFIKCDEEISEGASKVNGITKEKLEPFKKMEKYLPEFLAYMAKADYIIGHNVDFDIRMLTQEYDRYYTKEDVMYEYVKSRKKIDTMKGSMKALGFAKRPKLNELHNKLFGKDFENAHDALGDIRATKYCFLKLYESKQITLS